MQVLLRRPRRGTFLVAAVALAGLAPATAGAGTAAVFGRTLAYQASPGEANRVTVTRTPDAYRILDRGANVVAGAGCTSLAPNEVACAGDEVRMIRVQVLDGNDVVSLSVGRKSIVGGGDGDDVLEGGEGDDELYGDAGDDTLKGGAGFDVLTGATGADTMSGGGPSIGIDPEELGEDEFFVDIALYEGRTNGVTVDLDDVADDGEAGERDNVMRDVEVVAGGRGADTLVGNELANGFFSGPGRDMIVSGGGFDFIFGGVDADVLNAGAGRLDYLRGERGDDTILGGGGADIVELDPGNDAIAGGAGRDFLAAGGGNDRVAGGAGGDFLLGGAGRDRLRGGPGGDIVDGGRDSDALLGEGGDDALSARDGTRDLVSGGPGRDRAEVDPGLDRVLGVEKLVRPEGRLTGGARLTASTVGPSLLSRAVAVWR